MTRGTLRALLLASLIGSANAASASGSWSGFWTFDAAPPPGEFVWTWVWSVGPPSPTTALFSSVASLGGRQPWFYGIVIDDFGSLQPEHVGLSGLLSTEFEICGSNEGDGDLRLRYIGSALLNAGQNLGTVTLFDPDATPFDAPPVTLDYTATFQTTTGFFQDSGTISSAIPEPSTWAMILLGFAGLGIAGYRRARLAEQGCRHAWLKAIPAPWRRARRRCSPVALASTMAAAGVDSLARASSIPAHAP